MSNPLTIKLPDVGDFDEIEIIEILIASGDEIAVEDSIIVLESDKATMEIPSPYAGKVSDVLVKVGDRVAEGADIATIETSAASDQKRDKPADTANEASEAVSSTLNEPTDMARASPAAEGAKEPQAMSQPHPGKERKPPPLRMSDSDEVKTGKAIHASPSIRRYARELGVNLELVIGSGSKGRILKEDVRAFIKSTMSTSSHSGPVGTPVSAMPEIDFSKFGDIEPVELGRIKKVSGAHLHRSWITVPHVTQFDEANITELEAFRKSLAKEAEKKGVKLTPLVFLMKAVVAALTEYPEFNASLEGSGNRLILKKYFHIGVAVETPNGLMVPVIRDVDKKGLYELAAELSSTAARAREGKLAPGDMQGGCFTISSLGGIGGTQFTPIVNAPEVAILGVAKAKMQPVYEADGSFQAGLILPLALSYDHRVIDGAQGARFTTYLSRVITDIRRVLL